MTIDTQGAMGVNLDLVTCSRCAGLRCVSEALEKIDKTMYEIRSSGKCGEFTVKWNGSRWEIRRCDAPIIAKE